MVGSLAIHLLLREHSQFVVNDRQQALDGVAAELEQQLEVLERGDLARHSIEEFGALILVRDRDEAAELANNFATEHLHLACDDAEDLLGAIRHAGAIFVGPYSPVALGDYVAGPSHVLPTGATARFASGLSSNDFLRAGSVIQFTAEGLEAVADEVLLMANKEGLTGHARSISLRREKPE